LAIIIPENGAKVSKIKCFQFAQQTLGMFLLPTRKKRQGICLSIPCLKLIPIFYCRLCQSNSSATMQNKNSLHKLIVHK
ncbi:hypothetical protein, partial [Mediterraneibacter gnavus]|uniref:hypothetical protein n=1 Tax=Mediterraneibacter gnavus TaxID=33038 RepID=UPI0034A2B9D2